MGVTLVTAWLTTVRTIPFRLILAGLTIDYALGILLEFDRQSYVYPTVIDASGRQFLLSDDTLGTTPASEYIEKLRAGFVFLADHWIQFLPWLEISSIVVAILAVIGLIRLQRQLSSTQKSAKSPGTSIPC